MIADADDVETRVVGHPGVPKHLAHLVDTGLQAEAEADFRLRGHVATIAMLDPDPPAIIARTLRDTTQAIGVEDSTSATTPGPAPTPQPAAPGGLLRIAVTAR
jgi:hypothetical protein